MVLKPSQITGVGIRDDCGWKFLTYFLKQKMLVLLASA